MCGEASLDGSCLCSPSPPPVHALLPALVSTAHATGAEARVITYTAAVPPRARIDYATLTDGPARRRCPPAQLRAQSQLVRAACVASRVSVPL